MEAVRIDEESIEYRDPDGEFQVIYSFPRGYVAVGKNDNKADVSGESFDHLEDAIEHAEICLSIRDDAEYDDGQPSDYEEMQDYMGGDDWDHGQYDESVEIVGGEIEEDTWPHDEPFPKKAPVISGVDSEHMADLLHSLARDLAEEAIENAAGVWDEEGDGTGRFATGAQNQAQYVMTAAPRYLTKEYKKTIIVELQRMFDEAVQRELRNYHENR